MTLTAPVGRLTLSRLHAPTLETLPAAVAANVARIRESTDSARSP
ncbi:hypothetical protein [Microbacterium sp. CR_7]